MPAYNTKFKLGIDDLDLIETALQTRKKELSLKRLAILSRAGDETAEEQSQLDQINRTLAETHDLLGRLHNQKVFFRPQTQTAPYIGG